MDGIDGKPLDTRGLLVVGNGHFTQPLGHLINCFDRVVRLSSFQIKGFETLVGTKTNIVSVARIENLSVQPELVWVSNKTGFGAPTAGVMETIIKHYPNVIFIDENTFLTAYAELGYIKGECHPTLGFLTIWWAIQIQRAMYNTPLTICGFDFCHVGCRRYYWSDIGDVNGKMPDNWHNMNNERSKIKEYMGLGMIKMLNPRDYIMLDNEMPECVSVRAWKST